MQISRIRLSVWKFVFIAPVPRTFSESFHFGHDGIVQLGQAVCGSPHHLRIAPFDSPFGQYISYPHVLCLPFFTQRPFAPRALPRFPATMASSDYCPRLRYWQFSQVPVQNFRGTPSPLPRCARRTQIESVRRCWLHAYRIADHADLKLTRLYVGGSLALRLTALSGRTPAHRSPSARSAILIVCRFLYDIAPSAISSAELVLGVPVSFISDPLAATPPPRQSPTQATARRPLRRAI